MSAPHVAEEILYPATGKYNVIGSRHLYLIVNYIHCKIDMNVFYTLTVLC